MRLSLIATVALLALVSPATAAGRFFVPEQESASAVLAADTSGGLHAAHTGYDGKTGDFIYYRHCEAACEDAANWTAVEIPFTEPELIQIAVTSDGWPRLLVQSSIYVSGASILFSYGECDENCTVAENWTFTPIANRAESTLGGLFQYRISEHSFAVDGAGRPWFVYTDANYIAEPDNYGTFVTTCAADCTDAENWTDTNVAVRIPDQYATEYWDQIALAITPDGRPRLLGKVWALDEGGAKIEGGEGLYYYECDTACDDRANWRRTRLIETGYGSYPNPGWDLEVLPDGRPRAVLFAGSEMEATNLDNTLIYLWCDANCTTENSWNGNSLTARGDGEAPDLALTPEGQPRITFLGGDGDLGYLACDTDCESESGMWTLKLQDSTAEAAADRPTALPYTCDAELWNGFLPRIAIADGKPWFAYDLTVEGRCLYQEIGDPVITYEFHELWRGARLSWGEGKLVPPPSGATAGALPSSFTRP